MGDAVALARASSISHGIVTSAITVANSVPTMTVNRMVAIPIAIGGRFTAITQTKPVRRIIVVVVVIAVSVMVSAIAVLLKANPERVAVDPATIVQAVIVIATTTSATAPISHAIVDVDADGIRVDIGIYIFVVIA
jgi:hypothetical protein